jgi:hypothetical protein
MFKPVAASNRFVAEGIASHAASLAAARALAEAGTQVAFISGAALIGARVLEAVVPAGLGPSDLPGFRAVEGGLIRHANGVQIRLFEHGSPILGGPLAWPDPAESETWVGVPVLRVNAFLETEIARALNSGNAEHEDNAIAAILAAGAMLDRTLELHPYVAERYQDLWERAQSQQLWPAVA